ncbi:hypothetical protein ABTK79_19340, partial [Acinetobacter baumannii]
HFEQHQSAARCRDQGPTRSPAGQGAKNEDAARPGRRSQPRCRERPARLRHGVGPTHADQPGEPNDAELRQHAYPGHAALEAVIA